jgi:hypothetical protein
MAVFIDNSGRPTGAFPKVVKGPNNESAEHESGKLESRNEARAQGCIKLLDFSLASIGWRRGLGRGSAFLLVSPLLGPLPTRSSRGEDGELDAAPARAREKDREGLRLETCVGPLLLGTAREPGAEAVPDLLISR